MENQLNPSDQQPVTQEIKYNIPAEYKLKGSLMLPRGLKLFSYNTVTYELSEVILKKSETADYNAILKAKKNFEIKHNDVQYNPKCLYIIALNKKNASKK